MFAGERAELLGRRIGGDLEAVPSAACPGALLGGRHFDRGDERRGSVFFGTARMPRPPGARASILMTTRAGEVVGLGSTTDLALLGLAQTARDSGAREWIAFTGPDAPREGLRAWVLLSERRAHFGLLP